MSDTNKTLRIRTNVGEDSYVSVNLKQEYDTYEILSIKLKDTDTYKLHSANYGVIVGRVLANNGFGVPNAKISLFIEGQFDENTDLAVASIYPYSTTRDKNGDGIQYNLLPDSKVDDCHQVVGSFPNKTYMLDNDILVEVFDKYYKYTTRTNNSGDYLLCGVPTGSWTMHMDLDLSDCGILSQRPRDFVYKGYTIEQFENPNQFKKDTELKALSQIFSQDKVVNVLPFWGNEDNGETIGITRADINITFKFEPTCVFMGCIVGDNASNGISKKCVPTNQMGAMDELTTGEGTIEMIRKTPSGKIEEFQIKGTQVIDGNGVWCYQIPMNLDYMMTDEYGNMVPTDDPSKGIPTRTRVRFRVSMADFEQNTDNYFRAKVLVPNNPQNYSGDTALHEPYDYEFGSETRDESFRDLFWNNVYTVKSYIPRFQKSKSPRSERFTGIKHCNIYGQNNPMPYNNIRIRLPFMFTLLCVLIKTYIFLVKFVNTFKYYIADFLSALAVRLGWLVGGKNIITDLQAFKYTVLTEGLCPDLEGWYYAPTLIPYHKASAAWIITYFSLSDISLKNIIKWIKGDKSGIQYRIGLFEQTFAALTNGDTWPEDEREKAKAEKEVSTSIDDINTDEDEEQVCLTMDTEYLISCIEMNLAQEYKVINFDFYNDWVNGVIYMPRWMRFVRKKKTFLFGLIKIKAKVKACMDDTKLFAKTRRYTQQCALTYNKNSQSPALYTKITTKAGCVDNGKAQKCHKKKGKKQYQIFGKNGGVVHEDETSKGQYVYYFKPCEWNSDNKNKKVILFANDLVLLGSLNDCSLYGIPQAFKHLTSSSYIMPTNLALTNMDEDGYLYAKSDGTMCNTKISYYYSSVTEQLDPSFQSTSKYDEKTYKYGSNDGDIGPNYDDMVAITEAAGISWNYTGPGQAGTAGTINRKQILKQDPTNSLYFPGGHFLGLSCIKSQTNIKSCVNLQRICEAGSTMSQRREEVRQVKNDENKGITLLYQYFVPTGFISQEDINGSDFRSMFSTMNHNRLLCDKKSFDEKTGYPKYAFTYLGSKGFDGGITNAIMNNSAFNRKLSSYEVNDEYYFMRRNNVLEALDYDVEENGQTYTRTIEDANRDYYMFRMGLHSLSEIEQTKRFLMNNEGQSLPQYESSFYFYFGLKDGATALDEFTKQFFSVCESESILLTRPTFKAKINNIDICKLDADLDITTEYMVAPVTYTIKNKTTDAIFVTGASQMLNFTISGVNFGKYEITITDSNQDTGKKNVDIGTDSIDLNIAISNFEFRINGLDYAQIKDKADNLKCGGLIVESSCTIYGSAVTGWDIEIYKSGESQKIDIETVEIDSAHTLYVVSSADTSYDIKFVTECKGEGKGEYDYGTYYIAGIDLLDLYIGCTALAYSSIDVQRFLEEWWKDFLSDETEKSWAARHTLFRQTDNDSATFENKIYTYYGENKTTTALFGDPEKNNEVKGSVFYEGDDAQFQGYQLSEYSIIPTWGFPGVKRKYFGEMAVRNGLICSDMVDSFVLTASAYTSDANKITIKSPSEINEKIIDGHGCIIKYSNGEVVYPTRNGNSYVYYGTVPETGVTVKVYPIFYYPVAYRPFYANVYIINLLNDNVVGEEDEEGIAQPILNTNEEDWVCDGEIHNGITYNKKFSSSSCIIDNYECFSNGSICRPTDKSDTENIDNDSDAIIAFSGITASGYNRVNNYHFSVIEGSPDNVVLYWDLEPYTAATVEDEIYSNDIVSYISYYGKGKEDGKRKVTFNIEGLKEDSVTKYYYFPEDPFKFVEENGLLTGVVNDKTFLPYRYNDGEERITSACSKNILGKLNFGEVSNSGKKVKVSYYKDNETLISKSYDIDTDAKINDMIKDGFSPCHKYKINKEITKHTKIEEELTGGTIITSTATTYSDFVDGESIIIARYKKAIGNKGEGIFYRIYKDVYPLGSYDDGSSVPSIITDPATISATSEEITIQINVKSNVSWTVTSKADWITLSISEGEKNGVVLATLTKNETTSARTGEIEFKNSEFSVSATVECKQEESIPPTPPVTDPEDDNGEGGGSEGSGGDNGEIETEG